jgi:dihydropteroate synthase
MSDISFGWRLPEQSLHLGRRPLVMGILNVTPDSFSDGGLFADVEAAVTRGLTLIQEGADLLDIGGESSRPGARPVAVDEEIRRVLPVVEQLVKRSSARLSIDTYKAETARLSLAAGAQIINDITSLTGDQAMTEVVRKARAGVILMHMQGTPATMQLNPLYGDVVGDIGRFFEERLQALSDQGIAKEQIALDPGIGFGKTRDHNLEILARLGEFQRLGRPICLGTSRKGVLGHVLNRPVHERLAGSLATLLYAMGQGAVQIIRVHDVAQTRDAITAFEEIRRRVRGS